MMFATMRAKGLYPPMYIVREDSVVLYLLNEERPPVWEQASAWIDKKSHITNRELCKIARVDTLKASKMLKKWVALEMLIADKSKGKRGTIYKKPGHSLGDSLLVSLSMLEDNKNEKQ